MSDTNYKQRLEEMAKPYLHELQKSLSELIFNVLPDSTSLVKNSSLLTIEEESKALFRKLYSFQSILNATYSSIHSGGYLKNLNEYINFFNSAKVINIPLSDPKVKTLIENLNVLRDNEINKDWIDAFKLGGIDIGSEVDNVLTYLTKYHLKSVATQYDVFLERITETDKFITFEKFDATKIVLSSVKFRKNIEDIESLVLRSKEDYLNYQTNQKFTSKFLVVFIYTEEQDHTIDRFEAQFKKSLVEIDDKLVKNIFFIPISVYSVGNLLERIRLIFKELNGFEVNFDFSDSPEKHGWIISPEVNFIESRFIHEYDNDAARLILKIRLPQQQQIHAYYKIEQSPRFRFQSIGFIVKRTNMKNRIDVEVSTKDNNGSLLFILVAGNSNPIEVGKNEHEIYYSPIIFKNWEYIKIDIVEAFKEIFKNNEFVFDKIEAIKLSGELDISKIYLE